MSNPYPLPLPPDLVPYVPILLGLCRTLLGVVGSAGFTWALAVTDNQLQMLLGAAMIAVAALWSAYQKIRTVHALQRASDAPAGTKAPAVPM